MAYFRTLAFIVQCMAVANCVLVLPKENSLLYNSQRVDKILPSSNTLELPSSFKERLAKHHQKLSTKTDSVHHGIQKRDSISHCGLEGRQLEADAVSIINLCVFLGS